MLRDKEHAVISVMANVVATAVGDVLAGNPRKSGQWLVENILRIYSELEGDIRNGDRGWLMKAYGAAYSMATAHCGTNGEE